MKYMKDRTKKKKHKEYIKFEGEIKEGCIDYIPSETKYIYDDPSAWYLSKKNPSIYKCKKETTCNQIKEGKFYWILCDGCNNLHF